MTRPRRRLDPRRCRDLARPHWLGRPDDVNALLARLWSANVGKDADGRAARSPASGVDRIAARGRHSGVRGRRGRPAGAGPGLRRPPSPAGTSTTPPSPSSAPPSPAGWPRRVSASTSAPAASSRSRSAPVSTRPGSGCTATTRATPSSGPRWRPASAGSSSTPSTRSPGWPGWPPSCDVRPRVMVRVTTGVEAHTHAYIATAHEDQKFGFSIAAGHAAAGAAGLPRRPGAGADRHPLPHRLPDLRHRGLRRRRPADAAAARASSPSRPASSWPSSTWAAASASRTPVPTPRPRRPSWPRRCARSSPPSAPRSGSAVPHLSIEPGRAISGPSAFALYEVGTVKLVDARRRRTRLYVSVDGGMSDNIRTALYAAEYSATLASRAARRPGHPGPGGRQALRGRRHPGPRRVPARRHRAGRPRSPCRPPGRTAGRWRATTTTYRGRRWSRSATARSRP